MIKITTDSTCDLPEALLREYDITVLPLGIVKGEGLFRDGVDIHPADIAAHVDAGGAITTTNAVNTADYLDCFSRLLKTCDAVVHVNLGSKISSCHQNARIAAAELSNVYVADSDNITVGMGELVLRAARAARAGHTPEEILAVAPDGIMLTNGPGDPVENTGVIQTLRALKTKKIPTFGICLGHQLLALANGFTTCKLKYGHRGANQPVRELATGRVYITSQNHGYAVVSDSVDPAVGRVSFENNNDGSCEGIDYLDAPAFTVQFHPEACAGPQDTNALFGRFISMMEDAKNA